MITKLFCCKSLMWQGAGCVYFKSNQTCQKCQIPQSHVKVYKYRICNFHHFYNCGKITQTSVPHHQTKIFVYFLKQESLKLWRQKFYLLLIFCLQSKALLANKIILCSLGSRWGGRRAQTRQCQDECFHFECFECLLRMSHITKTDWIICTGYEYYHLFVRWIWIDCSSDLNIINTTNNTVPQYCFLIMNPEQWLLLTFRSHKSFKNIWIWSLNSYTKLPAMIGSLEASEGK